jgi:ATP-dependent RNA helicase RhlE
VQELAIEPALAGRNVVATAQTGTGKTLAFVLPLVQSLLAEQAPKGVRAVILSPTRELAIQIHEAFTQIAHGTGIRAAIVVGGLGENPQLQSIRKGAQVVIATPGRLYDFLSRQLVNLSAVKILVLDEADRMLDMGFLPSLQAILQKLPAKRQTMLFSATIERSVAHLVDSYVHEPVRVAVETSTETASQIDLYCYEVPQASKFDLLVHLLKHEKGSFLVFVSTKEGADRLSKFLERGRCKVACIHGDRSQSQRNEALQGFKDGVYRVLVATDVAARGIHVDDIAHVVNYDLPQEPEGFTHRVGRTGRAGSRGASWTFAAPLERSDMRTIESVTGLKVQYRELPPLPRPIGLVSDVQEFLASMSSSQPAGNAPAPTLTRSFSSGRRRSGRR